MNYLLFNNRSVLTRLIIVGVIFFLTVMLTPGVHSQDKPTPAPEGQADETKPVDDVVVTADSTNWLEIRPTGANAEFKMPTKPRFVERMFTPVTDQPPIKVRLHIGSFNQKTCAFVFSYHDLHLVPPTQVEIDNTLDGAIVGSIANVQGKPVSQQAIRYGDHPGRAFLYQYAQNNEIYQVSARVFLVGTRQYQISVLMKADGFDEKIAASFLDSLRLLVPDPESKIETKSEAGAKSESANEPNSDAGKSSEQATEKDSLSAKKSS